jgi:hypothetical protein
LDDDGNAKDVEFERRFKRFADELEWYAMAFHLGRANGVPY